MRLNRLFYFLALLLTLPLSGFGQTAPVAPSMLLDIGGYHSSVHSTNLKFDAQGNFYVTGNFTNHTVDVAAKRVDFDPSAGVTTLTNDDNCFIAKYSAAGVLVWVKSFSGYDEGDPHGLDIDRNSNITVIGHKVSKGLNGLYSYIDAFILHFDNNGNVLWEKFIESGNKNLPFVFGGPNLPGDNQTGYKVASDDAGNLIAVYGFQGSPDVDGKVIAKGTTDGLVVKYDTNGNVIWKFNLGAVGQVENPTLEALVDKQNNIIIAGYTNGTVNYNPLGMPFNVNAYNSMFVAKYSPDGLLQWIKSIDGNTVAYNKYNIKLALDGQDNIYLNGAFDGGSPINFGVAPTLTPNGKQDIFIAKYSSGGNLVYHKNMGGIGAAMLNEGLAVGPDNSLYLTGNFTGKVDVDPSSSVAELNSDGTTAMFLAKYDDNGNYQWAFRAFLQQILHRQQQTQR